MPLRFGSRAIERVMLGNRPVQRVMHGARQVWTETEPVLVNLDLEASSMRDTSSYWVPSSYWNGDDPWEQQYLHVRVNDAQSYNNWRWVLPEDIPANAVIESAVIRLQTTYPHLDLNPVENGMSIGLEQVSNPTEVTSGQAFLDRRVNVGTELRWGLEHSGPADGNSVVISPNLAELIQELLTTHGALSALQFFATDIPTNSGDRDVYNWSFGTAPTAADRPRLQLEYSFSP